MIEKITALPITAAVFYMYPLITKSLFYNADKLEIQSDQAALHIK